MVTFHSHVTYMQIDCSMCLNCLHSASTSAYARRVSMDVERLGPYNAEQTL